MITHPINHNHLWKDYSYYQVYQRIFTLTECNKIIDLHRGHVMMSSKMASVDTREPRGYLAPEPGIEARCNHCGRVVRETVHTRSQYRVDYYELHTGEVEESTLKHGEDGQVQVYQRLRVPETITTCADCYRDPNVRDEREHRYRPEDYVSVGEAQL